MKRLLKTVAVVTILSMVISCIPIFSFAAASAPAKVKNITVTQVKDTTKATIKWGKASSTAVKGYQIQRKVTGGTYKTIKTITSRKTVKFTTGKQTPGKTYYYRVRAYKKTSSGKKVFGAWSIAKGLKITNPKFAIKNLTVNTCKAANGGWTIIFKLQPGAGCVKSNMLAAASLLHRQASDAVDYLAAGFTVTYNTGSSVPSTWKKANSSGAIPVAAGKTTWIKCFFDKETCEYMATDYESGASYDISFDEFFKGGEFKFKGNVLFSTSFLYKDDTYTMFTDGSETEVENLDY